MRATMSRRTEILRRATEVFERQGFAHTPLEDIAKAVGIKREAIYYYFRSKAEILLEIILPQSRSLLISMRTIMRSNIAPMEKLHAAIEAHLDSYNPGYLEMIVALRESHNFKNDDKLTELRRIWRDYSELWVQMIVEGQEAGVFNPKLNAKMVAFGILGMCNWLSRWYDPGKDVGIPEIIETYFTMTAQGIAAPGAATGLTALLDDEKETAPAARP